MSIASEITRLQNAKASIKVSIENKGVTVGDGIIDTYASKIDAIETGITPTGTINITENGTYDVSDKASANVNVDADVSDYFGGKLTAGNSSCSYLFRNIKKIPLMEIQGTSCSYMFRNCSVLTTIPLLNTSNVTKMDYMFSNCSALTTIPLLDTSNVTKMGYMFSSCSALTTIPLLDTSNVDDVQNMFQYCSSLTVISAINISKATRTDFMFMNCYSLTTIPLLNMSSNARLNRMFLGCNKLENLGGFQNLGQAYLTTDNANNENYTLDLSSSSLITYDSLMNVINNLYDIATKGCNTQQLVLGSTNMAKLTAEEIAIATNKGWSVS